MESTQTIQHGAQPSKSPHTNTPKEWGKGYGSLDPTLVLRKFHVMVKLSVTNEPYRNLSLSFSLSLSLSLSLSRSPATASFLAHIHTQTREREREVGEGKRDVFDDPFNRGLAVRCLLYNKTSSNGRSEACLKNKAEFNPGTCPHLHVTA